MSDLADLLDAVLTLKREIGDLRTRLANVVRVGKVVESEHDKGVRVRIGGTDEKPLLSPWLMNKDASGVTSYRAKVGEQVRIISPNGDIQQAVVEPFDHSDEKKNPAPDGDTTVLFNRDDVNITIKDGNVHIKAKKKVTWEVDGKTYTFDGKEHVFEGDKVKHGDRNIGKDHIHSGVRSGGEKTQAPDP